MPRKTDKRVRLIEAAKSLIHEQGYSLTTLAHIAQKADVPLGNVYYYFKTKEAIGGAVIERRAIEFSDLLTTLNDINDPSQRLIAFVHKTVEELEIIAGFGCPIGGLCQELGKQGGVLAAQAAKLLYAMLEWIQIQFKNLGLTDKSEEYALHLVTSIQGMYLLTHTFKDPQIANCQVNTLLSWLEKVLGVNIPVFVPAKRQAAREEIEEAVY